MFLIIFSLFTCFVNIFDYHCIVNAYSNNSQINDEDLQLPDHVIGSLSKVDSISNNIINKSYITETNNSPIINDTLRHKRKRTKNHKKKRANYKYIHLNLEPDELTENSPTTTYVGDATTRAVTKKRKSKKKRRKKKYKENNFLETTTTKINLRKSSMIVDVPNNISTPEIDTVTKNLKSEVSQNYLKPVYSKRKDRCALNNGGCSQICEPKGKIKCSCMKGYTLAKDRKKCIDINECSRRNGGCREICRNTLGSYYCACSKGFRIADDLKSCQDINECHLRNGHGPCQDTCTNTFGSYFCDCSHLNSTRLGIDKHSCEDINECEEATPECSHLCINTRVGAFCSCPEGMELMSDYKTCQDVDECEDMSINSSCKLGCVNTIGSYYCEDDFQNDQNLNNKRVPVCPPLNPPEHGYISCLRNNSFSYDTYTPNGRRIIKNGPGTKCQLKCPIGFKLLGAGRFVCSFTGKWVVKRKGVCVKSSHPQLECPAEQVVLLVKGHQTALVNFPRPRTNVRWKIVKSYPKWAKNLKGELGEGRHAIQFSVTDPATKLSSTCSFFITIKT